MKVTMPRKELHPVTTARIENSNTWGSLYFSPCPRRGSGTSASRPSNGENGGMATSDSVATPGVRHSPIRESPFLSAASVRSARVAVRTHFGPSVSVEQPWRVTEAATTVRDALRGIGLESFVKTTGGKGLHVVVPLAPKHGWVAVKAFCRWVAKRLADQCPNQFTANQTKPARRDRIYIDYLRNSQGATAIGAYSPRARPGALVSAPLFWDEVANGVQPTDFTIVTVPQRIAARLSDPWAEIGRLRQSIDAKVRRQVGI